MDKSVYDALGVMKSIWESQLDSAEEFAGESFVIIGGLLLFAGFSFVIVAVFHLTMMQLPLFLSGGFLAIVTLIAKAVKGLIGCIVGRVATTVLILLALVVFIVAVLKAVFQGSIELGNTNIPVRYAMFCSGAAGSFLGLALRDFYFRYGYVKKLNDLRQAGILVDSSDPAKKTQGFDRILTLCGSDKTALIQVIDAMRLSPDAVLAARACEYARSGQGGAGIVRQKSFTDE